MGTLREGQYKFLIISHSVLLLMRNFSDKSCRENQNTHLTFNKSFFSKNCAVYEITWTIIEEPDRWQYSTVHALCMLDTEGQKYTLTIRNTSCFSTATMVTRTPLSVTLYVLCLSFLYGIITVAVIQSVKIGLRKNLNFNRLKDCFWCLCDRASLIQ